MVVFRALSGSRGHRRPSSPFKLSCDIWFIYCQLGQPRLRLRVSLSGQVEAEADEKGGGSGGRVKRLPNAKEDGAGHEDFIFKICAMRSSALRD
eukprot:3705898-Pyramimonas_sp.AAC.1